MRCDERRHPAGGRERLGAYARNVVARRKTEAPHARERDCLTTSRPQWRNVRVVARRSVRESGEGGGLSDAELGRRRAEVERARRRDTDGSLPQLYAVQVLLHDLLL